MRRRVDELERRVRELEEQLHRRDGGYRENTNQSNHSGRREQWNDQGRYQQHDSNDYNRGWDEREHRNSHRGHDDSFRNQGDSYRDHRGSHGDYRDSHRGHSDMHRGHRDHREESHGDRFPDLSFDENMNQYGGSERGPAVGFDEKRLVDLLVNLVEERLEIVLKRNGLIADAEETVNDAIVDEAEPDDGEEEI